MRLINQSDDIITRRREFLKTAGALCAGALLMPHELLAYNPNSCTLSESTRSLKLYNIHTNDYLDITYFQNGNYIKSALSQIDQIMIDRRSGETTQMNPRLLDTLHQIQTSCGSHEPIDLICGYRAPDTNAKMARSSKGVAKHSYHTRGMAADINIQGMPLEKIRSIARSLNAGGVGIYPKSGFVHVDVGPVRTWQG